MCAKQIPQIVDKLERLRPDRQGGIDAIREIALKNAPKGEERGQLIDSVAGFLRDVTSDPKVASAVQTWCGNVNEANQGLGELKKAIGFNLHYTGIRNSIDLTFLQADEYYRQFGYAVGEFDGKFVMEPPQVMLTPTDCVMPTGEDSSSEGKIFVLSLGLKKPDNPDSGVALITCYEPRKEVRERKTGWDGIYTGSVQVDPSDDRQFTDLATKMVDSFGEKVTPEKLAKAAIRHINGVHDRFSLVQHAIKEKSG